MRKKSFLFIFLISAITLNLGNAAFAANKVKHPKHKNIASQSSVIYAVAEAPDLEALKKEFYEEASKNSSSSADYTALLTKLSIAVSSADVAIPFLKDVEKKVGTPFYQFPAITYVRNAILFKYLKESSTPNFDQKLMIYESFQKETPSWNYLSKILWEISSHNPTRNIELNKKFEFYLSQLDNVIGSSSTKNINLLDCKGALLFNAGEYSAAIAILRPLMDEPMFASSNKRFVLSYIVESYKKLGILDELSADDLLPYVRTWGDALTCFWLSQIYRDTAYKYEQSNDYKKAIPYRLKTISICKTLYYVYVLDLFALKEDYKNLTKGDYPPKILMDEILLLTNDENQAYAFLGSGNGYFEKKEYANALLFLDKAYFSLLALDKSEKKFNTELADVRFKLGFCYSKIGDNWNAITYYKMLPEDMDAQFNLALIWIERFKSKRNAIDVINKLKKTNIESYNLLMDRYDEVFGDPKGK